MANIQWNQINPNFSSTASLADAATRSISQAGTIFGEMRKQILEEEQRTIDNAYREKQLTENTRQFEEQLMFNKQKENTRIKEWNKEFSADQQYRNKQLALDRARIAASSANNDLQAARLRLENEKSRREAETYKNWSAITTGIVEQRKKLDANISELQSKISESSDPNTRSSLEKQLGMLQNERKQLTATDAHNTFMIGMAQAGTPVSNDRSPFYSESVLEQNRTKAAIERSQENKKNYDKTQIDIAKTFKDLNLTADQQEYAQKIFVAAQHKFPNLPPSVIANIIATSPTTDSWFSDRKAFKMSDSDMDDFIEGKNNENNTLHLLFSIADMNRKKQ